ncbi:methylated-DNA--[protein]-cysteine S-methyltransferase [Tenacibaculum sp. UWU-22]|uniref:methylated-DNA--[protein]-cysteine S-methyltransferase n=1 Tax=Tenacibaculum sp. UWU-22 TaxID=3234187 RepID=UPI0034DB4D91
MQTTYYNTPIGTVKISGSEKGVRSVTFLEKTIQPSSVIPDCLKNCVIQLNEYFTKHRTTFNLKLDLQGTEFQQKVWGELLHISYGKTKTYLEQAKALKNVKAIRAIASANGKNPLAIIIPCHRVIGSNGSLTGYAGGIWRKKWLLEHEKALNQQTLF